MELLLLMRARAELIETARAAFTHALELTSGICSIIAALTANAVAERMLAQLCRETDVPRTVP